MPNPNYEKGRRIGYAIKKKLEERGFLVVRSPASKGAFDLLAVAPGGGRILLVSCKADGYVPPDELDRLLGIARKYRADPYVSQKKDGEWILEPL